ncbi:MAG: hypothetical protein U0234_28240 [Sandaracinus sp.]
MRILAGVLGLSSSLVVIGCGGSSPATDAASHDGGTSVDAVASDTGSSIDAFALDTSMPIDASTADVPALQHTVTLVVTGNGSVSLADGTTCPLDCVLGVDDGTSLTLTAAAVGGSVLDGWDGPCASARGACTFEVTSDVTLTATFVDGWTCDPGFYGDGTCDCGCGLYDRLDCADRDLASCEFCDNLGSCNTASCPGTIDPSDTTRCL